MSCASEEALSCCSKYLRRYDSLLVRTQRCCISLIPCELTQLIVITTYRRCCCLIWAKARRACCPVHQRSRLFDLSLLSSAPDATRLEVGSRTQMRVAMECISRFCRCCCAGIRTSGSLTTLRLAAMMIVRAVPAGPCLSINCCLFSRYTL